MISVIIAGGSGTRLWPLSTTNYPKHLLKIGQSKKSLLQNTYNRISPVCSSVYVVTDASHAHHVREQLPQLPKDNFIIEPARRGTASCILAGLERITRHTDSNEPIAFVASDHFVRDTQGFSHTFKKAEKYASQTNRIVLIGIEPDHPAIGFGYIEKGSAHNEENPIYNVSAFHEKPDFDKAQEYVASGNYLWNCSYFVATPQAFEKAMRKHAPNLQKGLEKLKTADSSSDYQSAYLELEDIAIDYALIEKVSDLLVVPATFDWVDLGSFSDLHKAVARDESQNYVFGEGLDLEGVENSYIENHEKKPLAVIGLDNIVVINSPNGVIVARKDLSKEIGMVAKRIQSKN